METRKITVSFGVLALVALHAFMIRVPLPAIDQRNTAPVQSFCFDTIEQSLANPNTSPVNAAARDEIKRADPVPESKQQQQARPTGDRVIKRFNLDLFVGTDAQSKQLLQWFQSDPSLSKVAAKCNYQVYATGDALYKTRYEQWVPPSQFPAIVLTRHDGGHCYVASRSEIPSDPATLLAEIKEKTENSIRASQLANQPVASQVNSTNSSSSNPNCPDGNCPPKRPDRDRPFFPDRNDEVNLFPNRQPEPMDGIQAFFRQTGIGLESVALLILAAVVVIAIVLRRN
jgi:hypothetical protein